MRTHTLSKLVIPMFLLVPVLANCSQDSNEITTTTTTVFLSDANPTRVLLAAVILASGDIEKALTEGLVTSIDVDAAAAAIQEGTLDAWRERAEADFSNQTP
jgi:hypothetical protein